MAHPLVASIDAPGVPREERASARVVTLGKNTQGKDFVPVMDPNHENKLKLETQVGPEQVAAARPDVVLLKSYMADTSAYSANLRGLRVEMARSDPEPRQLLPLVGVVGAGGRHPETATAS